MDVKSYRELFILVHRMAFAEDQRMRIITAKFLFIEVHRSLQIDEIEKNEFITPLTNSVSLWKMVFRTALAGTRDNCSVVGNFYFKILGKIGPFCCSIETGGYQDDDNACANSGQPEYQSESSHGLFSTYNVAQRTSMRRILANGMG